MRPTLKLGSREILNLQVTANTEALQSQGTHMHEESAMDK